MTQRSADGRFTKGPGGKKKGRPKGVPNKLTQSVRDAIAQAAAGLGGTARLVEWANADDKNKTLFWTSLYPKLLPLQVAGDPKHPINHVLRMERLIVDPADPDRTDI